MAVMTATEMHALINQTAMYPVRDMDVAVRIVEVKNRYGDVDVRIEPLRGTGATWVRVDSIVIDGTA